MKSCIICCKKKKFNFLFEKRLYSSLKYKNKSQNTAVGQINSSDNVSSEVAVFEVKVPNVFASTFRVT